MAAKVSKLTATQEADLRTTWQHWYDAGVSTAPADRPRAENAVAKMYEQLGRPSPPFVWVASPATGIFILTLLSSGASLRATLRDSLRGPLRASLSASLSASLRDSLAASLSASLWDSLGGTLRDSLRDLPGTALWDCWRGQHEANWVAYYRFAELLGVSYDPIHAKQLSWWADLAESCGWWAAYEHVAIMCDRPQVCCMEPSGRLVGGMPVYRLHSADGPALGFRDRFAVYAWHGVRVPQQLIESPDSLTREDLLRESNAEVRRAYRERLGNERFAALLDLAEVDRDQVGRGEYRQEYILWRTREPDQTAGEHIQFVECTCHSTGRRYMLCVRPDIRDVYTAIASTFPDAREPYAPVVEA